MKLARLTLIGWTLWFSFASCLCQACQTDEVRAYERGSIAGRLHDADGNLRKIPHVAVFVCDQATGYPLVAETGRPFTDEKPILDLTQLLFAMTDGVGRFEFPSIPVGEYRLVAQQWDGADEVQWMNDDDRTLILHGQATTQVTVDRESQVSIKPLGSSQLNIQNTPDEGNAFLLIGLEAPIGEPILSFTGWGDKFKQSIVGVTHMKRGKTVIRGLSDNADIYLELFNYDNNPGVGGAHAHTGLDTVATIPIYASWSNGYYQTPPHMQPLTDYLEKNSPFLPELVKPGSGDEFKTSSGRMDYAKLFEWAKTHAQDKVEVGDLGKFRVIDILAASSYLRIRQAHEARKSRK